LPEISPLGMTLGLKNPTEMSWTLAEKKQIGTSPCTLM